MTTTSTRPTQSLAFTGERFVPEESGDIALEHQHRYALAVQFANGLRVLDVACGEGYGSAKLAQSALSVTGVDVSPEAVAHATARYPLPNLRYLTGSASKLPLENGSFDLVVSFETIEHLHEQQDMLDELRRVLVPDGILFISSPNKRNYSDIPGQSNPYHVKELYREEFAAELKKRFRHVAMGGQRIVFGSLVAFEEPTTASNRLGVPITHGDFEPVYDLAIASNAKDISHVTSFLEGAVARSDHAMILMGRIQKLQSELDRTFASRSWKLTRPLRALQAIKDSLLGSKPQSDRES
jgi:2-polyprenyl-3-methyl-5-hydroxy-6-metoxy-1,4-benzoquinol methylase